MQHTLTTKMTIFIPEGVDYDSLCTEALRIGQEMGLESCDWYHVTPTSAPYIEVEDYDLHKLMLYRVRLEYYI